jgi:ferredoxin
MPRVSIYESNKTFEVKEDEIIYDALFDRGEELPHGCLAGSCGACKVEIISGAENLAEPGFIEKNTIESIRQELKEKYPDFDQKKIIRLSCRTKIKNGEVTIKPLKIKN